MAFSIRQLRKDAYTPGALIDAGLPASVVRTLIADGPRAVPERPRVALTGRKRADLTTHYVWGPDAAVLLAEPSVRVHGLKSAAVQPPAPREFDGEDSREGGRS